MNIWCYCLLNYLATLQKENEKKNIKQTHFQWQVFHNQQGKKSYADKFPMKKCVPVIILVLTKPCLLSLSSLLEFIKWYGVNNGNVSAKPLNYVIWDNRIYACHQMFNGTHADECFGHRLVRVRERKTMCVSSTNKSNNNSKTVVFVIWAFTLSSAAEDARHNPCTEYWIWNIREGMLDNNSFRKRIKQIIF